MANDQDALHADLSELLTILGMGDHARPQSPHEVFQKALGKVRERLQLGRNVDAICAENLTLAATVRQREMEIRKLSHECLGEAIRLLRGLMQRQDCDIPGESWLFLAIGTMETRQQEIAAAQMDTLAGREVA